MLHSLSFRPITDEVVDLSMIVNASPAPWQRSSEPPRPVWEMRLNLTDSSHDMARYETMDGASSCTARWVALVALGQAYYDWVVESIDVAGVAQIKRTIPGSAAAVK